jgi:hypothetical protein
MAQAFGASIKTVFDAVKDIINKDQQGFIAVDTFNTFAKIAQLNVYNRLFSEIKEAKKMSRGSVMGSRDKSRIKQIEEDLAFFAKSETISRDGGVFSKPYDFNRLISITTDGSILLDQSTRRIIDICYDEDKFDRLMLSPLSKPSEIAPLALISDKIEVYPTNINRIKVRYYKTPQSRDSETGARLEEVPRYQVTNYDSPDDPYSSADIQYDFELPERYETDLIIEICKMAGVNLRDDQVTSFASTEGTNKNIEENG